jgi:hypothetical protein
MSLQALIAPLSVDAFLSGYFEKNWLHVERNDPACFRSLLDDLDLERQIWRHSSRWGDVSLARAGTHPADNPYADGLPTVDAVADAYRNGYTVVVNNYQQKSSRIAVFCREVEKFFCFRCNANLYLTGPRCKGLNAHYDDQDVFVMQLDGMKIWRIYEGGPLLPMEEQDYDCPDTAGLAFTELALRPGDVLYLPRGHIHDAFTEESRSLHLTLSVSVVRQATFLRQLIHRLAEGNADLRRAMPFSRLRRLSDQDDDQDGIGLLRVFNQITAADLQRAYSDFQDRLLHASVRLPDDQLQGDRQRQPVTVESKVKIADDQICLISSMPDTCTLKFIGGQVPLSEDMRDAGRFVCEQRKFRVCEMECSVSNAVKVAFVQFLMDHGLLVFADE